jgi:hypothetical protein
MDVARAGKRFHKNNDDGQKYTYLIISFEIKVEAKIEITKF